MTSERKVFVGFAFEAGKKTAAIGLLKLLRRGVVESGQFAYGNHYVHSPDAVSLNQDFLPLNHDVFNLPERRLRDGGALPLTFRDALPDKWGRLVLQTRHGKHLDDIEALLMTNPDRVGAMVFSEQNPIDTAISIDGSEEMLMPLEDLSEAVLRLERQLEITPAMRRLLERGDSLGGARPKATFIYKNARWIAKFPAQSDDHDVEAAPHFGIKQHDADTIIQLIYQQVDKHLLAIIKQLGGNEVLMRRVEKCLLTQREMINS